MTKDRGIIERNVRQKSQSTSRSHSPVFRRGKKQEGERTETGALLILKQLRKIEGWEEKNYSEIE